MFDFSAARRPGAGNFACKNGCWLFALNISVCTNTEHKGNRYPAARNSASPPGPRPQKPLRSSFIRQEPLRVSRVLLARSFYSCMDQPRYGPSPAMRDVITLQQRLSLAGRIARLIPADMLPGYIYILYVEITLFPLADISLQHEALFRFYQICVVRFYGLVSWFIMQINLELFLQWFVNLSRWDNGRR